MSAKHKTAEESPVQFSSREDREGRNSKFLDALSAAGEQVSSSIENSLEDDDNRALKELLHIAQHIENTKRELEHLPACQVDRVPEASRELEEVVKATEQASNTIMEEVEGLLALEGLDPESYQEAISNAGMRIFEACSFQDITGQRIEKIVSTLNYIEERIAGIVDALGLETQDDQLKGSQRERRREEQLLHGPASEDDSIDQDDIDALF